jgi:hypothetical protein
VLFSLFYSNWIGREISIPQRLVLFPIWAVDESPDFGRRCADPEDQGKVPNEDRGQPLEARFPSLTYNPPEYLSSPSVPTSHSPSTPQLLDPILHMSMQALQSLYSRLWTSHTASHVDFCVFASSDGQQFYSYPPSTFGLSPNTFESVLPDLRTKLAIQASSPRIHAAIREA